MRAGGQACRAQGLLLPSHPGGSGEERDGMATARSREKGFSGRDETLAPVERGN